MNNHDAKNRLTFRHLALATAAFAALAVVGGSELPMASAHTSQATFGNATCLEKGGWGATLKVTATNPELSPVAHIGSDATPYDVAVPAAGYQRMITAMSAVEHITVTVDLAWSDGFTQGLGSFTAHRPIGCTPPTTSTPPTTTCGEAIPPRDDCQGVPLGTTPTFPAPATSIVPEVTTVAVVDSTPQLSNPANPTTPPVVQGPPRAAALPVTGAGPWGPLAIAGVLFAAGAVAIVAGRGRRSVR